MILHYKFEMKPNLLLYISPLFMEKRLFINFTLERRCQRSKWQSLNPTVRLMHCIHSFTHSIHFHNTHFNINNVAHPKGHLGSLPLDRLLHRSLLQVEKKCRRVIMLADFSRLMYIGCICWVVPSCKPGQNPPIVKDTKYL